MRISRIFRCSRGAVIPIIAVAAVPLIGIATWARKFGRLVPVKRHSQNAADSAAYPGALQLAIDNKLSPNDTNVNSAGRQFAAQNGFCSTGNTAYTGSICGTLPTGTTQTVTINLAIMWARPSLQVELLLLTL